MTPAQLKDKLLLALEDAYEDAGIQGLCDEGRWEAAVGTVRAMEVDTIAKSFTVQTGAAPMPNQWQPENYSRVSPYLIVDGAARTIDFLMRAFDAERLRHFPAEDGRVMHAEVRIGDSVIMIADGNEGWPPIGAHVHVYVPDVDETYRRALAFGAESVQEPVKKEDEDKRGGVRDAGGTTWWIATRVE